MANIPIPKEWQTLLNEHHRRHANAQAMGGKQRLERLRQDGRLNAREILQALVDKDSFMELGSLVGGIARPGIPAAPADALVAGIGSINGRKVVIGAEDFTVQGGSIGHGNSAKRTRLVRLAHQEKVPLVMLLDGAGERVTNSLTRYPYSPNDLQELAALSGKVPTVAIIFGASAGHSALTALLMDYIVILENATLFSAGPPLVAVATGEKITKEALGGSHMHTSRSGVAHNLARDELHACALVKEYLNFLPQNAWQRPPPLSHTKGNTSQRKLENILDIIPADAMTPYNIKQVIELLVDHSDESSRFYELQPHYGSSIVIGFGRLGGEVIAIVANQPQVMAGAINHEAAEKAAHFLELADAFHLPVLFLADNPGIMSGSQAEQRGTLRAAAKMYFAQSKLRSPKLHVTLRKAFGFGSSLMAMNPFDHQTISLALPGVYLGGIPAKRGSQAANLDNNIQELLTTLENGGAWYAADNMAYDEIIDPRELRNALLQALKLSLNRYAQPPKPGAGIRP